MQVSQDQIISALKMIRFPDSEEDIVSAGMIKDLQIKDNNLSFSVELPSPNNPLKNSIKKACIEVIHVMVSKDINIEINFISKTAAPPPVETEEALTGVKNIIAIASGKGGVGKSTVATNLAVALAKTGLSVGLIDADIFGPSIPKMFDSESIHPEVIKKDGKDKVLPVLKYGVKILSVGFFVKPTDALVWRGPMATTALKQLIMDAEWGELDYLLFDLPPGTSDIHLTLVQTVPVTGAVIVSTPQKVALADAIKGINMFKGEKINVPVLGLVENMSWFTPEELPDHKYFIFGKDGCKNLAEEMNIPLLGQIPIVQSLCESGDSGIPSALDEKSLIGSAFKDLARNVINKVNERNKNINPTQQVTIAAK
jgi:ATP-binding protein involved in chromosome partitioning